MPTYANPNAITLSREHTIFVVPETTKGTLAFPAATDLVIPAGYGTIGQQPTYTDSEEIVDSRSLLDQFRDALTAGDWSLPMYLRPSGSLGVVPQGAALFKALFGNQTITPSISVAYTLAKQLSSFSLWFKYGSTVFFAFGGSNDSGKLGITKKGALKWDMSGKFMSVGWVGTDELSGPVDGTVTPVTAIPVKDAKKYTVGGRIMIGIDDNAGAGFTITAVDVAANTLTINPGCESNNATDVVVAPFLPTGAKVGSPVESRTAKVSFDGGSTFVKIKGIDLTFTNGIQYMEDEIQEPGVENPTDYVEGQRSIKGSVTVLMRRDDLAYFYDGLNSSQEKSVKIVAGEDVNGKRASISMPKARLTVPNLSPSAPTVELKMDLTALGTNGEDEISMLLN